MRNPLRRKLRRDIRRQLPQFAAVTVSVFLGVALFAASFDSFRNLEASYDQTSREFAFANLTVSGGDVEATAAAAASDPGVAAVTTRTVSDLPLRVGDAELFGRAVGMPAGAQPAVNRVKVLSGGYLDGDATGILVEEHLAEHFDLTPGSMMEAYGADGWTGLTVRGVVSSPEYIWPARSRQDLLTTPENFGVIIVSQQLAERLTGDTEPNEVVVYYADGKPDDALTGRLREIAAANGADSTVTRAEQPSNAALSEDLKGFQELSVFFPVLFLASAAMASYVMINRLVHAQRAHIGLLFAEGFTRRQVAFHYLGYGLAPGLAGAVPGVALGALLAQVITGFYTDLISVPVRVVELRPGTLVSGVAFGLFTSVVAALAPALTASRIAPAQAMRGTVPTTKRRLSVPERVVPPLRRAPVRWLMALRGVERSPRRTVYTMIGVILSLTLVLVSWGMLDTTAFLLDRQFNVIQLEDARVHFAGPVTDDAVGALAEVPGVAAAEPELQLPAVIISGEQRYETAVIALPADTAMHWFDSEVARHGLPDDGLLAGRGLATIGVEPGSSVQVALPAVGVAFVDTVRDLVDEPLGTLVYTSFEHAAAVTGIAPPVTSALVRYDGTRAPDAVRRDLTGLTEVVAVEDTQATLDVIHRYMGLFYGFVGMMLVFGSAMSFALIFNAMSVNLAERTREIGTLMALGTDRKTVSRLVTSENLLVVIAATPLGLLAGYMTASAAMSSFSSDLFQFELHMRPSTLVLSAVAMLIVAGLSQWPGLRALRRIDLAGVVRERGG